MINVTIDLLQNRAQTFFIIFSASGDNAAFVYLLCKIASGWTAVSVSVISNHVSNVNVCVFKEYV